MADIIVQKSLHTYSCGYCDYYTSSKKDYNKHIMTRKHQNTYNKLTQLPKSPENIQHNQSIRVFKCNCGNSYFHRQSLHKHQKKCSILDNNDNNHNDNNHNNSIHIDKNDMTQKLVELIMSKNQEFMNMIMDKIVDRLPNITNNTNTNSHNTTNNQFNIQMFLNEHCKNAMNLTDFIESLPITAATFDNTIENGLTKTITNMITNGLSKLDILERPIHCTDVTRKTLYVKEANVWEKDTELKKVVAGITNLIVKKRDLICKWKEANRGWDTIESKQIRFTELVCNLMTDVERDEKETGKIIRSISKIVYLDNEEKKKYIC